MAVAGKAAITMHGAWSSTTDYDRLCGVVHNNSLFISRKKPPIGVAPTEGEYWMLCIEGVNEQDLDALAERVETIEGAYYPNTGGQISGNVTLKKAENGHTHFFKNHGSADDYGTNLADYDKTGKNITLVLSALYDLLQYKDSSGNFHDILHSGNFDDFALPLTGGVIKGSGATPLDIQSAYDAVSQIAFFNQSSERLGYLGFNGTNVPQFTKADSSARYALLHEGNKPFGSYTGNGNTAQREIAINGIGRAILIYKSGSSTFSLITPQGGIMKKTSGLEVVNAVFYINDKLTMSTNNDMFNTSGATYYYQVL